MTPVSIATRGMFGGGTVSIATRGWFGTLAEGIELSLNAIYIFYKSTMDIIFDHALIDRLFARKEVITTFTEVNDDGDV